MSNGGGGIPNVVRTCLIVFITIVWGFNITAPVFVKDYTPAPEINIVFTTVIGALGLTYRRDNNSQHKNDPPTEKGKKEEGDDS